MLYIYLNHKFKQSFFPKELTIAIVFSFGIMIASGMNFDFGVFSVLFGLVLSNVLFYSFLGIEEDKNHNLTSSLKHIGEPKSKILVLLVLTLTIVLTIFRIEHYYFLVIILIFYFLTILLDFHRKKAVFLRLFGDNFLALLILSV